MATRGWCALDSRCQGASPDSGTPSPRGRSLGLPLASCQRSSAVLPLAVIAGYSVVTRRPSTVSLSIQKHTRLPLSQMGKLWRNRRVWRWVWHVQCLRPYLNSKKRSRQGRWMGVWNSRASWKYKRGSHQGIGGTRLDEIKGTRANARGVSEVGNQHAGLLPQTPSRERI